MLKIVRAQLCVCLAIHINKALPVRTGLVIVVVLVVLSYKRGRITANR